MKWVINEDQYHKTCGAFWESPIINSENISWKIYVYPNGHHPKTDYIEIWLSSVQHSYPSNIKALTVNVLLTCSVSKKHFNFEQSIPHESHHNMFSHQFEHQIKIKTFKSHSNPSIEFLCNINILKEHYEEQKSNISPLNHKAKQVLLTSPSFTKSEIHYRNTNQCSFQFKISNQEYATFLSYKIGQKFTSPIINNVYKNAEFILDCYPNGQMKDVEGSMSLGLRCITFPHNIRSMFILFDVYCVETDTYYCNSLSFSQEKDNYHMYIHLLPIYHIERKEIEHLDCITFNIALTVLRAKYSDDKSFYSLGYIQSIKHFVPMRQIKASWTLPITTVFFDSKAKHKMFVSKRFDLWCLRCLLDRGKVLLEVYLVCAPSIIQDLMVRVSLKCPLFNIEWNKTRKLMFGEGKYIQWSDIALYTEQLKGLESITFLAHIEILQYFNRKNREVFFSDDECE